MKFKKYLGFISVSLIIISSVAFSSWKNSQREIGGLEVVFFDDQHDFLNVEMVNKLLIQNQELMSIGLKDLNLISNAFIWMFLISLLVLLLVFVPKDKRLNRLNGTILLGLYVYFIYGLLG